MSEFPRLNTGAFAQYPVQTVTEFRTDTVRFVDGSEQRFRNYAGPVRRWVINLESLDDSELTRLREFVHGREGAVQNFEFTNPFDGQLYATCSFENEELSEQMVNEGRGRVSLVVRNR